MKKLSSKILSNNSFFPPKMKLTKMKTTFFKLNKNYFNTTATSNENESSRNFSIAEKVQDSFILDDHAKRVQEMKILFEDIQKKMDTFDIDSQLTICYKNNYFKINRDTTPLPISQFLEILARKSLDEIEKMDLIKHHKKIDPSAPKTNKFNVEGFFNGKYFNPKLNVYEAPRLFITNKDFTVSSLEDRNLTTDFTKKYNPLFQENLNLLLKDDSGETENERKLKIIKPLYQNNFISSQTKVGIRENTLNKTMNLNYFFKNNSEKIKFKLIKEFELEDVEYNNLINQSFIVNENSQKLGDSLIPISLITDSSNSEETEKRILENFSIQKSLVRKFNKPFFIGVVTDLTNWKILMFKNNYDVLETEKNFFISNNYKFQVVHEKQESEVFSLLFFNFMKIIENSLLFPEKLEEAMMPLIKRD